MRDDRCAHTVFSATCIAAPGIFWLSLTIPDPMEYKPPVVRPIQRHIPFLRRLAGVRCALREVARSYCAQGLALVVLLPKRDGRPCPNAFSGESDYRAFCEGPGRWEHCSTARHDAETGQYSTDDTSIIDTRPPCAHEKRRHLCPLLARQSKQFFH